MHSRRSLVLIGLGAFGLWMTACAGGQPSRSGVHATNVAPETLTVAGAITGTINREPFEALLSGTIDMSAGTSNLDVRFPKIPASFHPFAASGLSLGCWSCSGAALPVEGAASLGAVTQWNYDLERTNIFPDGNRITMTFKVRKVGDRVTVDGAWQGTYALPTNIDHVEAPIREHYSAAGSSGVVTSEYTYAFVTTDGKRFEVRTPSTYRLHQEGNAAPGPSLQYAQVRISTFSARYDPTEKRARIVMQSLMQRE